MMKSLGYHWFSNATRRGYVGPRQGALICADGSTVALDFTNYSDTNLVRDTKNVVGLGLLTPANGEWAVEVKVQSGTLVHRSFRGSAPVLADAIALARAAEQTAQHEEDGVRANPELHLERELARHDWWSHMSDDAGVAAGGEAHGRGLQALVAQVAPETARFLWAKYAPAGFNCPV